MSTTDAAPLLKTHKIRLRPNAGQRQLLAQHCGYARVAYNHALADFKAGLDNNEWRTAYELQKRFNAVKNTEYPWNSPLSQSVPMKAIGHLGRGIANWKANRARFPRFHKKGQHDSYQADNGRKQQAVKVDGKRVWLPKIGWVRMREPLRFTGDIVTATVSRTADWWYISITVETPDYPIPTRTSPVAGVDVGINPLAMVSDGTRYENPRAFARMERKLRRLQKAAARSRNVYGRNRTSNRRRKVYRNIARLYARATFLRQDTCHKATTAIAKQWGALGIESLHVKGMLRNRKLARSLADASMGELLRQLAYKAQWYGVTLVEADQWYPSTQTCSACGVKREEKVTLSEREFVCHDCGFRGDRDWNAARNLQALAKRTVACGPQETLNGHGVHVSPTLPSAMNGEMSADHPLSEQKRPNGRAARAVAMAGRRRV